VALLLASSMKLTSIGTDELLESVTMIAFGRGSFEST